MPRFATCDVNGRHAASFIFPLRIIRIIEYHPLSLKSARKLQDHVETSSASASTKPDRFSKACFTPSGLAYVLYRIPEAVKYEVFTIPKKGEGERTIKVPKDQLALVQSRSNDLISGCAREIRDGNERYLAASHGSLKKKYRLECQFS